MVEVDAFDVMMVVLRFNEGINALGLEVAVGVSLFRLWGSVG